MREEKIVIGTRDELEEHFSWINEIPETEEEILEYIAGQPQDKFIPWRRITSLEIMLNEIQHNNPSFGVVRWFELREISNGPLEIQMEIKTQFVWMRPDSDVF